MKSPYYCRFCRMSIKKIADRCEAVKKEDLYLNLSLLNTSSSLIAKASQPSSLELRFSIPESCRPKQKKLNSSIRRAETDRACPPQSFKKSKSVYESIDFNANKKVRLSIVKTISLCYVSEIKTISKRIPYISKIDVSNSPQPSKDKEQTNYDLDQKFAKMNMMAPKTKQLKELISRNKNLMTVNQALLEETQLLQQEIIEYDFRLAEKTEILQYQQKINKELMRQTEVMERQKKQSEGKVMHLLKVNEQLVRDSNNMKQKIKENMKDIRMIRVEMGIEQSAYLRNDFLSANN